jgi:hypothetical protein
MNTKWRPAMGWMYMLVCIMDFVIFPILWSLVQVVGDGKVESQWQPYYTYRVQACFTLPWVLSWVLLLMVVRRKKWPEPTTVVYNCPQHPHRPVLAHRF